MSVPGAKVINHKMFTLHVIIILLMVLVGMTSYKTSCLPTKRTTPQPTATTTTLNQTKCHPKPVVEIDGTIILAGVIAEENDPVYPIRCPLSYLNFEDSIIEIKIHENGKLIDIVPPNYDKKYEEILSMIKISWYKDSEPLTKRLNGNRMEWVDDNATLLLYQFRESDAGHYSCIIDYSCVAKSYGQHFTFAKGAEFDVMVPTLLPDTAPAITHPPISTYALPGQSVTFTCTSTETMTNQKTSWFRSCPFTENKRCLDRFIKAYNDSIDQQTPFPMHKYLIKGAHDETYVVQNVTANNTGYYGCVVDNDKGIDIRYATLDTYDNWYKAKADLNMDSLTLPPQNDVKEWIYIVIGMGGFLVIALIFVFCYYILKCTLKCDKKNKSPLISADSADESTSRDLVARKHLPSIEPQDIYNTGKSLDGYISGHFHQENGHLTVQSICGNRLGQKNPSISSSNSQSDESSSGWGKSTSSSGDNCKAFYTHASHTTATTVPMYDHPPSTGTLRHCSTFVQDACVINPTYGFLRPENDATDWAFPRRNLDRLDRIGEGQFGEVWRYIARRKDGNGDIVAVKQLKNRYGLGDRERLELIAEIEIMKSVNSHPNVIKLLHFCVDECEPTLLIMEYAENGKLQAYLRKCREPKKVYDCEESQQTRFGITSRELIKFTYHIAKGMEYVASKGIVHRDLASRNILVSKDRVCKVADFGFARRVNDDCAYERTTTNPVPVKWMAPEALVENKFTSKSDVFSLGILMWEIVTLGATPYEQLTSEGVYKKVTTGGRLDRPPHCKDEFFNLMAQCWLHDPVQRPTFKEVACQLEKLLMSENDYIELDQYPEHAYYNIQTVAEKEVVSLET